MSGHGKGSPGEHIHPDRVFLLHCKVLKNPLLTAREKTLLIYALDLLLADLLKPGDEFKS